MATIALDIGGTKIASAIFLSDGSMMFNRKRLLKGRTGHEVGKLAADILAKLLTVARKSRIQIDGVGVCIPGIVYSQTNRVWAPNIPGWDNYPLYEELRCVTPPEVDIYIDSDRTCYMYGEMWQGAAKNCHSAVFIAVKLLADYSRAKRKAVKPHHKIKHCRPVICLYELLVLICTEHLFCIIKRIIFSLVKRKTRIIL